MLLDLMFQNLLVCIAEGRSPSEAGISATLLRFVSFGIPI
jgi:hypothetical protein